MEVLPKRFGKYGLTLHPDKTRLVPFRRRVVTTDGGNERRNAPAGHVRPLGVYPLLGHDPGGRLGR